MQEIEAWAKIRVKMRQRDVERNVIGRIKAMKMRPIREIVVGEIKK